GCAYPLHSALRTLRALHPFPTRRSSDLRRQVAGSHPLEITQGPRGGRRVEALQPDDLGGDRLGLLLGQVLHDLDRRGAIDVHQQDRKSTRLNSSHVKISYAVFCLKKKTT